MATCNPMDGVNKPGSIGLPLPGTMVEIVSLDDRSKLVPLGEKGEICVKGPQVMKGYWKRPEETAEAMAVARCIPAMSATWTRTATPSSSTASRT